MTEAAIRNRVHPTVGKGSDMGISQMGITRRSDYPIPNAQRPEKTAGSRSVEIGVPPRWTLPRDGGVPEPWLPGCLAFSRRKSDARAGNRRLAVGYYLAALLDALRCVN